MVVESTSQGYHQIGQDPQAFPRFWWTATCNHILVFQVMIYLKLLQTINAIDAQFV